MKSIFLKKLEPIKITLSNRKSTTFFILILIDMLEYEKNMKKNLHVITKLFYWRLKFPVADNFHVVKFSVVE